MISGVRRTGELKLGRAACDLVARPRDGEICHAEFDSNLRNRLQSIRVRWARADLFEFTQPTASPADSDRDVLICSNLRNRPQVPSDRRVPNDINARLHLFLDERAVLTSSVVA